MLWTKVTWQSNYRSTLFKASLSCSLISMWESTYGAYIHPLMLAAWTARWFGRVTQWNHNLFLRGTQRSLIHSEIGPYACGCFCCFTLSCDKSFAYDFKLCSKPDICFVQNTLDSKWCNYQEGQHHLQTTMRRIMMLEC